MPWSMNTLASKESLTVASLTGMARLVAREIATLIEERRRAGRAFTLGLAAGKTPLGVYAELARMHRDDGLSFAGVLAFGLDEYLGISSSHPQAYRQFFAQHLLAQVDIPRENVHLLSSELHASQVEAHARDFEREIQDAGGLDLVLLGIGENGHIGFNEPGSARDSRTRAVDLQPTTRQAVAQAFGGLERVPERAITMGVGTILDARRLRVMATGRVKRDILQRLFETDGTSELPATFARAHADVQFFADVAAAGQS